MCEAAKSFQILFGINLNVADNVVNQTIWHRNKLFSFYFIFFFLSSLLLLLLVLALLWSIIYKITNVTNDLSGYCSLFASHHRVEIVWHRYLLSTSCSSILFSSILICLKITWMYFLFFCVFFHRFFPTFSAHIVQNISSLVILVFCIFSHSNKKMLNFITSRPSTTLIEY